MKWLTAAVLSLAVAAAGVGLAGSAPPSDPLPPKRPAAGVDRFGDPLPKGAVARLGTVRFRGVLGDPGWSHRHGVAPLAGGRRFATCGRREVIIWDTSTGRPVRRLRDGSAAFSYVCSSQGGRLVAAGGKIDGVIRVWSGATGKLLHSLKGHKPTASQHDRAVTGLAFRADGLLVSVGIDGTLRTWDVGRGVQAARLNTPPARNRFGCTALSSDASHLARIVGQHQVGQSRLCVLDTANGTKVVDRPLPGRPLTLACSPDGSLVAVAFNPPPAAGPKAARLVGVALYDGREGREIRRLGDDGFMALAFVAGGRYVVAGPAQRTGRWRIWDVKTGKEAGGFVARPGGAYPLKHRGRDAMVTLVGSVAAVRDARTGEPITRPAGPEGWFSGVHFLDDRRVVTAQSALAAEARVWDWRAGRVLSKGVEPEHGKSFGTHARLSPDGRLFAARKSFDAMAVRRVADGTVVREFPSRLYMSGAKYAVGPEGKRFASSDSGKLVLYEIGRRKRTLPYNDKFLNAIAFSPDGRLLAAAVGDGPGPLRIWDVRAGREVTFRAPAGVRIGSAVAFSPDGRLVAAAHAEGGTATVWEVASRRVVARPSLPSGEKVVPTCLAFDQRGRWLAAGYGPAWIKANGDSGRRMRQPDPPVSLGAAVWDILYGREAARFAGRQGGVTAVALSPDGRHLATAGTDTTTLIWRVGR